MAETVENKKTDMTVQLIRDELRDEISFSRKTQRDQKLNKNRSILGVFADNLSYTEDFVTVTAKCLRKKTLDVQNYRKLQTALIQSENHINAFFKVDNAIQGLSRDLSSRSTQSKLAAANCCCNLSLGNAKACIALSKFVGPYLIAELESTNQPLAEVCAWTIGNLVTENKKSFSILHAQGCMKLLINLARQSSDTLFPAASYALLRYINTGIDLIEETDINQVGEIVAARYPTVSDIDTMWLLALLSSELKSIDFLIKCAPAVFKFLVKASGENENIEKLSAALRIAANTVTEPTGQVATALLSGDFCENRIFIDNLLSHQYPYVKSETLWLIGNLYNHPMDLIRQKIQIVVNSLSTVKDAINSIKELSSETSPLILEQTSSNSLL